MFVLTEYLLCAKQDLQDFHTGLSLSLVGQVKASVILYYKRFTYDIKSQRSRIL